jgi:DNA recombination protein RmuC
MGKVKDKLDQAGRTLDEARGKTTTIARRLREVEAIPEQDADQLLGVSMQAAIEELPPNDAK